LKVNSATCWFILYGYVTMHGKQNFKFPFSSSCWLCNLRVCQIVGCIYAIKSFFFSFHPLFLVVIFYFKSKLDQAFVIWNSITSADANKAEYIHRNFHLSVLVVSSHTSIQVCRYIRLLKIVYFTWEAASTFWTLFVLLFTSALNSAVSFRHDWHSNFYSKSYKISYFTVRSTWKNIQLCLDSHRLLMLSLATSMYLKLLTAIVFYIDCDKFLLTEVSFS